MIKRVSLNLFCCAPLILVFFWQGSSCHSTKANKNSPRNENVSMNSNSTPQSSDVKGTWGAQGISMEVTDSGADIGYDCAHGSITEKIVLDSQGHFSARGRHASEHGGPIRLGEEKNDRPATYRGSVKGDTMTLTVTLSGSDETVGTFTLTHGKSGRLRRCL